MSDCGALRESMPLLLTESLDPVRREMTHQHIENCDACSGVWTAYRETWRVMDDLPEVAVPARAKARFLQAAGIAQIEEDKRKDNVVPFRSKPAFKWVAQAAAVAVLVGGGYFAGRREPVRLSSQPAMINEVTPISTQRLMPIAE